MFHFSHLLHSCRFLFSSLFCISINIQNMFPFCFSIFYFWMKYIELRLQTKFFAHPLVKVLTCAKSSPIIEIGDTHYLNITTPHHYCNGNVNDATVLLLLFFYLCFFYLCTKNCWCNFTSRCFFCAFHVWL